MTETTRTIVASPFARIEGDIKVEVEVEGGRVSTARVSGTLYRAFERMLVGRPTLDAIGVVPRVCGKCSIAHAAAAAAALRDIARAQVPRNGVLATSVMLGAETVLNHLAHFYFLFAPDFAAAEPQSAALRRFASPDGESFQAALTARRDFLPVLGLFAGKWPNSLATQPGGSTRPVDASEVLRALAATSRISDFVEARLIGGKVSHWLAIGTQADLEAWVSAPAHAQSDIAVFVRAALDQGLDALGRGPGTYLSVGGWGSPERPWPRAGFFDGALGPVALDRVTEHLKHAWFDMEGSGQSPAGARTIPAPDREGPYSWSKAPRYAGKPVETGPLARMVCDEDPLVRDVVARRGPGVLARVLARLQELVRLSTELQGWMAAIDTAQPFCASVTIPESGEGVGAIEAPRGTLAHWVVVEGGRIRRYQIVTPTAWNFSPRDDADVPGPAESALVGTPVGPGDERRGVLSVVKSFDPCLYCSAH